jgi:hypothetical protein
MERFLNGEDPYPARAGMVFFFSKFKYFKIVMILLMLNVNADVCVLISDVVPPLRMPCQFVKV